MNQTQGKCQPRRDLAGGISKALTHTFLGLALAVPCLACVRYPSHDRRPPDGSRGARSAEECC